MAEHECVFAEEQEPEGRLVLGPCLACGLSALDALDKLRQQATEAAASALRDVADEIERELICCDVYERGDESTSHAICYWSGASRSLVLSRAEAVGNG